MKSPFNWTADIKTEINVDCDPFVDAGCGPFVDAGCDPFVDHGLHVDCDPLE